MEGVVMSEFKLYAAPSMKLVTISLLQLANEAIDRFIKLNLYDADISDIIGELSGYEFITTEKECGGFCNGWEKQIAIVNYDMPTLLHELSHTFQFKDDVYSNEPVILSWYAHTEQQCESIAKYMFTTLYPNAHHNFDSYFKKDDILFLKDWYGDYAQDDILCQP